MTGQPFVAQPCEDKGLEEKIRTFKANKSLSKYKKVDEDLDVSVFEGLNLKEYLEVKYHICSTEHHQPCLECASLIEIGNEIKKEGYLRLNRAFSISNPGDTYKSTHAKRKLLQIPLAAIKIADKECGGQLVYLVDKNSNLATARGLLKLLHAKPCNNAPAGLSKETIKNLFQLSESEAERERLTFAISKASGLSSTKLRNLYGFQDLTARQERVESAMEKAKEIRESIEFVAQIKENAILRSFGISVESDSDDDASESEESCSDSEDNVCEETAREACNVSKTNQAGEACSTHEFSLPEDPNLCKQVTETVQTCLNAHQETAGETCNVSSTNQAGEAGSMHEFRLPEDPNLCKQVTETGQTYLNTHQLMDLLQECQLNWFCFAEVLKQKLSQHQGEHLLDQVLLDFSGQLPYLNLSLHVEKLIEQSRQAYLTDQRLNNLNDDDMIVSESEEEGIQEAQSLSAVTDIMQPAAKAALEKRVKAVRRKSRREFVRQMTERRLLKRKRSRKLGRVLRNYPDIGRTVEEFVKQNGVGADAWRRTGVLTFDGNRRLGNKVTYSRIKEHLQKTYKTTFSYGTVVQLCMARNKRRKSSQNYKGVARVTCRRTRKGFTIRYNPDQHWSSALYRGLDYIQYADGTDKIILNRDDQAGFRLDTHGTHNKHATLCVQGNVPLATKTDFVTKYPAVLQTTSYNFTETKTTTEQCAGIVKAIPVHCKNPAQHASDVEFLEQTEAFESIFINQSTDERKKMECIRVDGGNDEGPGHVEVQFFWTKRHMQKETIVQLVTTRDAGSSNRNRVELQNGCLAQGHTNLYIPSTLNGSCMENGKVDNEKLCKNLNDAIDVYISRVDGCPCGDTQIHLFKGPQSDGDENQKLRDLFKIYIKGSTKEKEGLKKTHPDEYRTINEIWNLRNKHMVKGLPAKYVFHLVCCYEKDCIHPECQRGPPDALPVWYPGGPPVSFLPMPVPDIERYVLAKMQ